LETIGKEDQGNMKLSPICVTLLASTFALDAATADNFRSGGVHAEHKRNHVHADQGSARTKQQFEEDEAAIRYYKQDEENLRATGTDYDGRYEQDEEALRYYEQDKEKLARVSGRSGANTIKMCVQQWDLITKVPSEGAFVECWDKDPNGDDHMTKGTTGKDGCVVMSYAETRWDGLLGGESPDIYCSVNKQGYVVNVPGDLDHHDQSKQAVFDALLHRDRSNDHPEGGANKCGPEFTSPLGLNYLATKLLPFDDQCFHHDMCYWDCKLLAAFDYDQAKAKKFCDDEMHYGMKSTCYYRYGNLPGGGDSNCMGVANTVWGALRSASMFYTLDKGACLDKNSEAHESWNNDYDSAPCTADGQKCGYDGTTHDEATECLYCCAGPNNFVRDEGYAWDDLYCGCLPNGHYCGTTLVGKSFNNCGDCCSGGKSVDDGWTYDNYYCKS